MSPPVVTSMSNDGHGSVSSFAWEIHLKMRIFLAELLRSVDPSQSQQILEEIESIAAAKGLQRIKLEVSILFRHFLFLLHFERTMTDARNRHELCERILFLKTDIDYLPCSYLKAL